MREDMVPQPEDPYGIAKYAVELDLENAHKMFGLDYVTFRPHNVYGEYQNIGDRYRNVVGIFMNQILQKRDIWYGKQQKPLATLEHCSDVAFPLVKPAKVLTSALITVL
jgi:UDP-glucose 4-epimerase